jgi:hypothetical protein
MNITFLGASLARLKHWDISILAAAISLKQKIEKQFGWECNIPTYRQTEELL